MELQDNRVQQVYPARPVQTDSRVLRDHKEVLEQLDLLGNQEILDQLVPLDQLD